MKIGHITIDESCTILHADAAFGQIMRQDPDSFVGTKVLDVTAPADRERCVELMAGLLSNGRPVATVKRLIRHDLSHVWVMNRAEIGAANGTERRVHIAIEECAPPAGWVDPAELLDFARFMVHSRRARAETFPPALFADHAWDILLSAYISESEGKVLTIADIHASVGFTLVNASRWLRALNAEGLIEYEEGGSTALVTAPFRLSSDAHARFESYLGELHLRARTGVVSETFQ